MSPKKDFKKQTLILLTLLTILTLILTINAEENITIIENSSPCSDNIDNDNDGLTDLEDPGCINQDDDETDCYINTDCGIDECAGGDNYCADNNVFQIYIFFTCNNPGQNNATCSNYTDPFLIFDCGKSYCEEYTENYCQEDNLYKDRICYSKGCANKDCFSNKIQEQKLIKECKHRCKKGKCKSKETGKWRDYPNNEPELEIQTTINPKINYTLLQESIQKITIPNNETKNKNNTKNYLTIILILITALLIFILTYFLSKPN